MRIAIVDDAPEMRAMLRNEVESLCPGCAVQEFASGEALLLCGQPFAVCLLDIKLKGQDGMETARQLRARGDDCAIVFITAHPGFVYDAFDVEAVQYLVKPVDKTLLARVLQKALQKGKQRQDAALLVKQGQNMRRVPLADILLLEAAGHKLRLHLQNGEVLEYYGRMEEAAQALDERFFRCHRAFAVNLCHVVEKRDGCALLPGGLQAPIARKRMKEFTNALLRQLAGGVI